MRVMKFSEYIRESKSILEAEEDLKQFQKETNIQETLKSALKAVNATTLDYSSIFKTVSNSLDELLNSPDFVEELNKKNLKASEITYSGDFANLLPYKIKYCWIYAKDSDEYTSPVYMLLQDHKADKWSTIRLYYIQKEAIYFEEAISAVSLEISSKDAPDKKWIYRSTNSGNDWSLKNKKDATSTFKTTLDWKDLQMLIKHTKLNIRFY